jgi:hypothetical protein
VAGGVRSGGRHSTSSSLPSSPQGSGRRPVAIATPDRRCPWGGATSQRHHQQQQHGRGDTRSGIQWRWQQRGGRRRTCCAPAATRAPTAPAAALHGCLWANSHTGWGGGRRQCSSSSSSSSGCLWWQQQHGGGHGSGAAAAAGHDRGHHVCPGSSCAGEAQPALLAVCSGGWERRWGGQGLGVPPW